MSGIEAFVAANAGKLALAVGGLSAVTDFQSQRQAAAVARYNAEVAEQSAASQRQWGEAEAARAREASRRQMARMRAAQGASGVEVGSGSFGDVLADDAMVGELQALSLLYESESRARQFDTQAAIARSQTGTSFGRSLLAGIGTGLSAYGAMGGPVGGAAASNQMVSGIGYNPGIGGAYARPNLMRGPFSGSYGR